MTWKVIGDFHSESLNPPKRYNLSPSGSFRIANSTIFSFLGLILSLISNRRIRVIVPLMIRLVISSRCFSIFAIDFGTGFPTWVLRVELLALLENSRQSILFRLRIASNRSLSILTCILRWELRSLAFTPTLGTTFLRKFYFFSVGSKTSLAELL